MSKYGFKKLIVWQKAKALARDILAGVAVGATFAFALH